eukprot:358532-Chlamydomonas_euryale.AAC.7
MRYRGWWMGLRCPSWSTQERQHFRLSSFGGYGRPGNRNQEATACGQTCRQDSGHIIAASQGSFPPARGRPVGGGSCAGPPGLPPGTQHTMADSRGCLVAAKPRHDTAQGQHQERCANSGVVPPAGLLKEPQAGRRQTRQLRAVVHVGCQRGKTPTYLSAVGVPHLAHQCSTVYRPAGCSYSLRPVLYKSCATPLQLDTERQWSA